MALEGLCVLHDVALWKESWRECCGNKRVAPLLVVTERHAWLAMMATIVKDWRFGWNVWFLTCSSWESLVGTRNGRAPGRERKKEMVAKSLKWHREAKVETGNSNRSSRRGGRQKGKIVRFKQPKEVERNSTVV
jgi:hypothetical protein